PSTYASYTLSLHDALPICDLVKEKSSGVRRIRIGIPIVLKDPLQIDPAAIHVSRTAIRDRQASEQRFPILRIRVGRRLTVVVQDAVVALELSGLLVLPRLPRLLRHRILARDESVRALHRGRVDLGQVPAQRARQ